jgi:transcriptional regulator with XRE-family HTH domain
VIPVDLDASLSALGWTGRELCRRLGVHPNTVTKWRTGKAPVPAYAREYLRVMLLAKEILV